MELDKDKVYEMQLDANVERACYNDEDVALEVTGVIEAIENLQVAIKKFESYGWVFNYDELK